MVVTSFSGIGFFACIGGLQQSMPFVARCLPRQVPTITRKNFVMHSSPYLIVSLDVANYDQALELAARLDPASCRLKVGKELFTQAGPAVVEALQTQGFRIFLDLKYHDIPHTVAKACLSAARLGVWMISVHTCGGRAMLNAAHKVLEKWFAKHGSRPMLIGVTVLTSMRRAELMETGIETGVRKQVSRLSQLAKECQLDGVVCSAWEAAALRRQHGKGFCLVTPGIRMPLETHHDQKRVMGPRQAILAGSHYLVVGRPIIAAPEPLRALQAIVREIKTVLH